MHTEKLYLEILYVKRRHDFVKRVSEQLVRAIHEAVLAVFKPRSNRQSNINEKFRKRKLLKKKAIGKENY